MVGIKNIKSWGNNVLKCPKFPEPKKYINRSFVEYFWIKHISKNKLLHNLNKCSTIIGTSINNNVVERFSYSQ